MVNIPYGVYEELAENVDFKVGGMLEYFDLLNDEENHEIEGGYNIITVDPFSDEVQEVEIYYRIKVKE